MELEPTTVYVRDLPFSINGGHAKQEISEEILISLCGQYANVEPLDVFIQTLDNFHGFPCSYACIQVINREEAERLINTINFIKLNKKPIHLILFDDETQKILRNENKKSLVVHHLSSDIEVSDLYNIFKEYGEVIDCDIPEDGNENSNNIAYVLFRHSQSAHRAIEKLEGASFNNHRPIHIEYDNQNTFLHKFVLPDEYDADLASRHKSNHKDDHDSDIPYSSSDVEANSISDSDSYSDPIEKFDDESERNKKLIKENKQLKKEISVLKARIKMLESQLNQSSDSE